MIRQEERFLLMKTTRSWVSRAVTSLARNKRAAKTRRKQFSYSLFLPSRLQNQHLSSVWDKKWRSSVVSLSQRLRADVIYRASSLAVWFMTLWLRENDFLRDVSMIIKADGLTLESHFDNLISAAAITQCCSLRENRVINFNNSDLAGKTQ